MKREIIITSLGLMFSFPTVAAISTTEFEQVKAQYVPIIQKLKQNPPNAVEALQNINNVEIKKAAEYPKQASFDIFPIETTAMSPGKVEKHDINLSQLPQPLFIVGSDELSQQWLKRFANQLKQINAIGFLVQANNYDDWNKMKQLAGDIALLPMSGNALSQQWNINYYPILISQSGIEQ